MTFPLASRVARLFSAICKPLTRWVAPLDALRLAGVAVLALPLLGGMPLAAQTAHYVSGWNGIGTGLNNPTGVAIDTAGNVYIADQNTNTLYKETLSGGSYTQSIISSGFQRAYSVAVDSGGNVFVTDGNAGSVYMETPSGGSYTQTLLANDGAFGVGVDSSNNVYTVTLGAQVNEYTPAGGGSYTATSNLVTASSCYYATGVAVDGSGNIYIACDGSNPFYVQKETPAGGGSYTQTSIGSGLINPTDVVVDGSGNVYIADSGNNRVLLETFSSGNYTQSVLFSGSGPEGVALDGSGNLYIADTGGALVLVKTTGVVNFGNINIGRTGGPIPLTFTFDTGGTLASTAVLTQGATRRDFQDAGNDGCNSGQSYNAGDSCVLNVQFNPPVSGIRYGAATLNDSTGAAIATARIIGTGSGPQVTYSPPTISTLGSGFSYPQGVAVDGSRDVFVGDSVNNAVKEITASSGYNTVNTLAVTNGHFSNPAGLAVDSSGDIFVADVNNNAVKEIVAVGGVVSSSSTVNTVGSGFSHPEGVAVDGSGNVFVADNGHNQVKEIVAVGGVVSSSSTVNVLGSGFSGPFDVAVDGGGNVFVADYNNNAVKEIVAGTGGAPNGTVNSSSTVNVVGSGFSSPGGVAVDGGGNVYVADTYNSAMKEIIAGTGGAPSGTVNSSSTVNVLGTGFSGPYGVVVDGNRNVFVADTGNTAVKEMNFADAPTLNFATTVVGFTSSDSPQTVTLSNIGNVAMSLPIPSAGNNPSIANNFSLNSAGGSACPLISSSAGSPGTLAVDTSCTLPISFVPLAAGSISGSLVFTDTALNQNYAQQGINLSGTGTVGVASQLVFATPPPPAIDSGGYSGTITVNVQDVGTDIITSSSAPITLTVTGPSSYSQTYGPINATNGVVSFDLSGVVLTTVGTYTYTVTSSPLTQAQTTQTVVAAPYTGPSEPVGTASTTQTATVTFSSSFTLNSISVVTQGATGLDFNFVSGGTCAVGHAYNSADTCTVNYTFTPTTPGERYGAIVFSDSTPTVQATAYLFGRGTGGLATFYPGVQSTVANISSSSPIGIAVDATGDVYISAWYPQLVVKETLSGGSYTQSAFGGSVWGRPGGGIAVDGAGNVYVADTDEGVVMVPITDTTCATRSDCISIGSGLNSPFGVAVDGSGNVYIADTGNNQVLKETFANGSYTQSVVANSGLNNPRGVAVDGSGNVYIADTGNNRVLKETFAGSSYSQSVINSSLAGPQQVAVDGSGNVYIGDTGHGNVLLEAFAGGSYTQSTIASGVGSPIGITVDSSGNVYFSNGSQVVKQDVSDPPALSFATTDVGSTSSDSPKTETLFNLGNAALTFPVPGSGNNPAISANFTLDSSNTCPVTGSGAGSPGSLALGASCTVAVDFAPTTAGSISGALIFTDNSTVSTQNLSLSGTGVSVQLATVAPTEPVGTASTTQTATVTFTSSVTLNSTLATAIQVVTQGVAGLDFQYASGGTCAAGASYTNGQSCTVNYTFTPTAPGTRYGAIVFSDSTPAVQATVYLTGTGTGGLATFYPGKLSTIASNISFNNPNGIAVDAVGNLYIADGGTNNVYKETLSGGSFTQSVIASNLNGLTQTSGVAVDGAGNVFIADAGNNEVLMETLSGGSYTQSVAVSGVYPTGVAVDANGTLYIADSSSNQVYKEVFAAGSYTQSVVTSGLNNVTDVAVDGSGNVYIADDYNNRLLKETPSGGHYTESVIVDGSNNVSDIKSVKVDGSGNVYFLNYNGPVYSETPSGGSYTQSQIVNGGFATFGIALDSAGNVYGDICCGNQGLQKLDVSDPPLLSFATTNIGSVSSDSPQTTTLINLGNAALTFPVPGIGNNPSITTNFVLDSSNTCTVTASGAGSPSSLAQGASCTVAVDFAPTVPGNLSGSLIFTDNSSVTTQSIALISASALTQLAFSTPPPSSIGLGGNAGTMTVQEMTFGGALDTTATNAVTLTVTGPNRYSQTYGPTAAVAGVASFDLSGAAITFPGTYTYTATSSPLSSAVATEVVKDSFVAPTEPMGTASGTQTATLFFTSSFTLGSISVVTQGATGLDYAFVSGGTCTISTSYTSGQSCTVEYTFTPKAPGLRLGAIVLSDSTPTVQATVYLSGTGTGPLGVLYPGTQSVVANSGLSLPRSIAVDASGNVYIVDVFNNRVLKETPSGGSYTESVVASSGLNTPQNLALDGAGNVYIADSSNARVLKETLSGGSYTQSVVADSSNGFSNPNGLAVDGSGNVYIGDWNNSAVYLETLSGGSYIQSLIADSSNGVYNPYGLAVDGSGDVYIAATNSNQVFEETPSGGGNYTQSQITSSSLNQPVNVAVDANGDVYISDNGNSRILLETLAGGSYTERVIANPSMNGVGNTGGVAVDGSGNVYIGDEGNNQVLKLDVADTQALAFPSTYVGYTPSLTDSLFNIGNASLTVPVPGSGANASVSSTPAGLSLDNSSTCPQLTPSSSAATLATGAGCTYVVDFIPTAANSFTGSVVLTDNSPNSPQTLLLTGSSTIQIPTQLAFAVPPPALPIPSGAGGNAGIVTVNIESSDGYIVLSPAAGGTASVTLTVTGPAGYSQTYGPTAAVAGVATFNLSSAMLTSVGTYTYTATSSSLTPAVATETLPPTEPVGTVSSSQTATVVFSSSFTLNSIQVLTQGATGLDFKIASGGTCTVGQSYNSADTCTVNYTFTPTAPGARNGAIVFSDSTPTAQATVYLTGTGTGPLGVFYPGTQSVVANDILNGLSNPGAIAVDGYGNIYIDDWNNNQVLKETLSGGSYTQSVVATGLSNPQGIAVDGAGNVYIVDNGDSVVWKETPSGSGYTQTSIGSGFNYPWDVAVDGAGNIYVADSSNYQVLKETLSGGSYTQSTVAQTANYDLGVAVDASGNVYIADTNDQQVLKETPLPGGGYSQSTIGSGFNYPVGVSVDGSGNVYVADTNNNQIVLETPSGSGYAQSVLVTQDVPSNGGLSSPWHAVVDGSGNLYIADTGNNYVLKLDVSDPPTFSFATTTNVGTTDTTDGPQTATLFNLGNAALSFPAPGSGNNPSLSTNFSLDSSNTCPVTASGAGSPGSLALGTSCTVAVDFAPTLAGSLSGSLIFTDNSTATTQTISLSGTGNGSAPAQTRLIFSTPPPNPIALGANAGSIPVEELNSSNALVSTATDAITLTVTGPNSYSQTYGPTNAVGGVASFNLASVALSTAGTYTYTAAFSGLTSAVASEVVNQTSQTMSSFTAIATPVTYGVVPLTLSATATSGLPATFRVVSGPASITGASNNQLTITGAGTVVVGADQPGNVNYTAATEVTQTITVNPAGYVVNATGDDATGVPTNCTPNPTGSGSGSCMLRDAVAAVTSYGGGNITFDTTVFATTHTIALGSAGTLNIPSTTTITGATTGTGATLTNLVTVAGGGPSSDFSVFTVGSATTGTAITNLTISNGNSNSGGGGINNAGTLSVTGCTFSNNSASEGGGIYSVGPLMVSGSTFAGNFGTHGGGGIATYTDTLTVINSSFTGNSSGNYGGGIYSIGTLTLTGSTFSGNSAIYDGGGLDATNGTVTDSTFYGNSAAAGGGIYSQGTLTVTSSTISGNTANSSPGLGGGIFNQSTLTLSNSILSGNSTTSSGGSGAGIFGNGGQIVNANHNVFYNNIDSGSSEDDCADTCTNNNAISGDPKLLPLGNYGGTMQTMLPQPGSAAICAGLAANVPVGVTTDQRGKPNTTSYGSTTCIDAGAVQTKYALNFTAQQPSNVVAHATMSPSPVVTVLESGSTFTAGSATVSLSDTDSDLGASATISASTVSGVATFSNLNLTHPATGDTLTAALALNTSLNATALSSSFNISIISQSITFVPTITSYSFSAGSFAVSATATSGLPVHFASTTGGVCSASGTTVTILAVGTCTIQATQTGNTDYSAAAPVAVNFTINQATQAISFTPASPVTFGVSPITLSATGGASGNTVSFSVVSGPGTVSGSTLTVTGAGTIVVAANQAGNTNYAAAIQVTHSVVVNQASQTISFTAPTSPVVYGVSPITLSATGEASSNAVVFSVVSGPGTVSGSTLTVTGAGTVVVAANQAGNTNYAAATQVTHSVVVAQALPAIAVVSSGNPALTQSAVTFTATLSSAASTPTGTIAFEDGATVLGSGTLAAGVATFTTSSLAVGTHTMTAVYSGDVNFAAATSASLTQTIQDFSLIISTSSGSTGTVTQSVAPGGTAAYTFNMTPDGGTVFPAEVDFTVTGLPAGATATFTPPSIAAGSGPTTITLTVNMPQQTGMLAPDRKPGIEPLGRRLAPIALGMLLLPFAGKMRRSGKRLGRIFLLLLLLASAGAVMGLSGCGGDNGFFTQAPQSYTLTITASSGGLQRSTNVTLNLQ